MEKEVAPYRKSKNSSISKSDKKSKHKHIYKDCIIEYTFTKYPELNGHLAPGKYCIICNQLKEKDIFFLSEIKFIAFLQEKKF